VNLTALLSARSTANSAAFGLACLGEEMARVTSSGRPGRPTNRARPSSNRPLAELPARAPRARIRGSGESSGRDAPREPQGGTCLFGPRVFRSIDQNRETTRNARVGVTPRSLLCPQDQVLSVPNNCSRSFRAASVSDNTVSLPSPDASPNNASSCALACRAAATSGGR